MYLSIGFYGIQLLSAAFFGDITTGKRVFSWIMVVLFNEDTNHFNFM